MLASDSEASSSDRPEWKGLAKGAAYLLGVGGVVHTLDGWLQSNPLAANVLGVVVIDLVGRRVGLTWDEEEGCCTAPRKMFKCCFGFSCGAAIALVAGVVAVLMGRGSLAFGRLSLGGMALGLASSVALGARDALLYRGMPLAILKGRVKDRHAIWFSAMLVSAPMFLLPDRTVPGVALAVLSGAFFALLWKAGQGMWLPWGAQVGWLFAVGPAMHGMVLDFSLGDGALAPMRRAHGLVAGVACVIFALAVGRLLVLGQPTSKVR